MQTTIEQQCNDILKRYLQLAEKNFGKLPKHCYETKIEFLSHEDNPNESHHADTFRNVLMINQNHTNDIEWTIFHEMEHIRTAKEIGKSAFGGVRVHRYPNSSEVQFDSANEALTDMSVERLLGRKDTKMGYYETIQLTRQIGALLGLENDEQMLEYYRAGGYEDLKAFVEQLFDDADVFLYMQIYLDKLHKYHLIDIAEEFNKFGKIENKPLGSITSENTYRFRNLFHDYIFGLLNRLKESKKISNEEYEKRLNKMEDLSPYKNYKLKNEALFKK